MTRRRSVVAILFSLSAEEFESTFLFIYITKIQIRVEFFAEIDRSFDSYILTIKRTYSDKLKYLVKIVKLIQLQKLLKLTLIKIIFLIFFFVKNKYNFSN